MTGRQTREADAFGPRPASADTATALDERGAFLLSQLGYHTRARFAEIMAPLGLQPAHFGILSQLVEAEGMSQQQLADTLTIHRNVMVGLIDDLEARGLVQRHRHPHDRRTHQIRLTASALTVLAQADNVINDLEDEMFAPLTDSERTVLIRLLQRTATHAGLPARIHPGLVRRKGVTRTRADSATSD